MAVCFREGTPHLQGAPHWNKTSGFCITKLTLYVAIYQILFFWRLRFSIGTTKDACGNIGYSWILYTWNSLKSFGYLSRSYPWNDDIKSPKLLFHGFFFLNLAPSGRCNRKKQMFRCSVFGACYHVMNSGARTFNNNSNWNLKRKTSFWPTNSFLGHLTISTSPEKSWVVKQLKILRWNNSQVDLWE